MNRGPRLALLSGMVILSAACATPRKPFLPLAAIVEDRLVGELEKQSIPYELGPGPLSFIIVLVDRRDFGRAMAICRRILPEGPTDNLTAEDYLVWMIGTQTIDDLMEQAQSLVRQGRDIEALAPLRLAIRLGPRRQEGYLEIARIKTALEDYPGAVEVLKEMREHAPSGRADPDALIQELESKMR